MTDEPPHASGPVASRYGLIRPQQDRYVAGVCAALGRATNTDPVLWRVVLAVLVCFGGIGALAYLGLWLLTPEEGDTASPLESLLGRGESQTSPVLTVTLGVISALLLLWVLPRPLYILLLGGAVVLVAILLANHRSPPTDGGRPPEPPVDTSTDASTDIPSPPTATGPADPAPLEDLASPIAPVDPTTAGTAGYRPPFAPYGPFGGPTPAPEPPPPRERSPLAGITFFAMLGVLGGLGMLDLAGVLAVPVTGYLIAALAVVGLGLLIGAWAGRARPLIALGLVLLLALPVVHVAENWRPSGEMGTTVTWLPTGVAELDDHYELTFGEGVLDLRQVDFSEERVDLTVRVTGGEIQVLVPPMVAVTAHTDLVIGSASMAGETVSGLITGQTITDPGDPEQTSGELVLQLHVRFGSIEVER